MSEREMPDAGQPALTRREARAREAAASKGVASSRPPTRMPLPEPDTILVPSTPVPVEVPLETTIGERRRGVTVPKKSRAPRRAPMRAARTASSSRTSLRRGSSLGSKFASFGALIIAGALLVGTSLPINALVPDSTAVAATDTIAGRVSSQTLMVSADALDSAPVRDGFDVISYAQVLALKYAGVDYSYSVTSGAVRWPFPYAVPITDGFGSRSGGFHKGVDFVPGAGTPIYAIADGVASSAGYDDSGYGNHVVIQHNLGGISIKSNYAHLAIDSSPIVAGQQIRVGDFLGLVGDTGISYGAHLHFEIYIDGVPVDPFVWLQANASDQ